MKKSAYYSDLFFAFSLSAFCLLFILRFLGVRLIVALFPSILLGAACAFLLAVRLRKKQRVFSLKKSEEKEKENLFLYLGLAEPEEIKEFLEPRLPLLAKKLCTEFEEVAIKNQPAPAGTITCEGFFFLPLFLFRELNADDVACAAKSLRGLQNAVVLCDKLSLDAITLSEKLCLQTIQGNFLYRVLKDENVLPKEFPLKLNTPKRTSYRALCFAKSNSKQFFKSGVLLSAYSFFTPYSIYYTAVACLFFTLSIFIRIFGYR
ncbi:MAG: hypothetical protein IKA72_05060 [Clostridia bacterium]|nr:hypothetical protein [Clostridia bacterium]